MFSRKITIKFTLLFTVGIVCAILFYKLGRLHQAVDNMGALLGAHVSDRYKMAMGDIEGVMHQDKMAIYHLTLMANDCLDNPFVSNKSKRHLINMLRRTKNLDEIFPIFTNSSATVWLEGLSAYSNAINRASMETSTDR